MLLSKYYFPFLFLLFSLSLSPFFLIIPFEISLSIRTMKFDKIFAIFFFKSYNLFVRNCNVHYSFVIFKPSFFFFLSIIHFNRSIKFIEKFIRRLYIDKHLTSIYSYFIFMDEMSSNRSFEKKTERFYFTILLHNFLENRKLKPLRFCL